jgi:hypothetical protein
MLSELFHSTDQPLPSFASNLVRLVWVNSGWLLVFRDVLKHYWPGARVG